MDAGMGCQAGPDINASLESGFCIDCLFPIRIATVQTGEGPLPPGVTGSATCSCSGMDYGVTLGSWHPSRLIEVTTQPGCSGLLGNLGLEGFQGTGGHGEADSSDLAFFHVHVITLPADVLGDLFGQTPCHRINSQLPSYFSEMDPTWNHSMLSALSTPELNALSLPPAVMACSADAAAALSGETLDELFWCAGVWGRTYPTSGMMKATSGMDPKLTSLAATRALALLHRRGEALMTVGDAALCGGIPEPYLLKSHYRMNWLFPGQESTSHHAIGTPYEMWEGPFRTPAPVSSHHYLLWQWEDCCIPLI